MKDLVDSQIKSLESQIFERNKTRFTIYLNTRVLVHSSWPMPVPTLSPT